ncbi:MAG: ferritin family protein [Calditrichaeota bacterium]|jgi:rubrerythrin|nr:ferritin family protein [Calditrichota bacterium]MBT7617209.1 ferritin family protein [Calditrichota bacterium]MBT7790125.1 ferritin family protein [Calditrichota bacterium]
MLNPQLTIVEVLGLAIVQEITAYKRYQLFAGRVKNPLVKERFHSLANEEKAHREILYTMLQKLTNEDKPPLPRSAPRLDEDKELSTSLKEILELAISKEQEAKAFYEDAALLARDNSGRQLLEYLATFEEGHERTLQAELDSLTKYPRWFDMDGPDIMLVGH